jgi:hypothetical protein
MTMKKILIALGLVVVTAAPALAQITPPFSQIKFFKTDDGSATVPAWSFTLNPNSGFYRIGTNNIGLATNGVKRVDWNTARMLLASGYNVQIGANTLTTSDLLDATKLSGLVPTANGGLGTAFLAFSGPASTLKTYSLPNASSAILTDNAAVTTTQGGTGASTTATSGRYLKGNGSTWATSTGSASGVGACASNTWASTLNSDAAPTCTQPASSNLSDASNVPLLNATNSFTGTENFTAYSEKKNAPSISSNTLTIDLSTGNYFVVSLNAAITTLTLSNPPASGKVGNAVLVFVADGTVRAITWPAAVKWAGGVAPTMTGTNTKIDVVTLITYDGGTSYLAFLSGQAF